jgi:DNA modification methylase
LNIQRIAVQRINPAPYNPRKDLKPGDPEYEKLQRSIGEFGYVDPIIWNKRTGNLVGGHQRFKILLAQGATRVEVSVVDLSPEKERALNLALNKISGDWDQHKLAELLDELSRVPDFDLGLTGFDPPDIDALVASVTESGGSGDPDGFDVEAELAAERPVVTQAGDLILLGRDPRVQHRLLCGDCTDPAQVQRVMDSERAALFATDPPYLVDYDGTNHPGVNAAKKNRDWSATYGVTWDDSKVDPELYAKFLRAAVQHAIRPNAPFYIWHASKRQAMLEAQMNAVGAFVHCQIIWAKPRPVLTRSWYLWQHEPCLMGWLKGKRPRARGGGVGVKEPMRGTVWQVDGLNNGPDRPDHPTPKPVELFAIPMRQHTRPGEVCYEPFAGSGTQIIAAQQLKRRCCAIEISPRYCDLIVRRFIGFAGEAAVDPKLARRYRVPASEVAA